MSGRTEEGDVGAVEDTRYPLMELCPDHYPVFVGPRVPLPAPCIPLPLPLFCSFPTLYDSNVLCTMP